MELKLFNKLFKDIFQDTGLDISHPTTQKLIEEYSKDLGLKESLFNNIKKRLKEYNQLTKKDVKLRYYQILALYFTEKYFEDYYKKTEFNKMLAYWMATGSGKTIIMHINILQYIKKLKSFDRVQIILTTPGVNLIKQHKRELVPFINELNKQYGNKIDLVIETTGSLLQRPENFFDLPERSKIKRIILVDEGHIGLSVNNEGKFKKLREKMNSNESFLFEYSATYHHLNNTLKNEYENTIIYDYNYKLFYRDGYGKAYSFKEINPDIIDGEKDNLDETFNVFEEKLDIFNNFDLYATEDAKDLFGTNFPHKPLLAFMGNTVSNLSDEGKADETSDISKVIVYLSNLSDVEKKKYSSVFNNDIQGKLRLTRSNNVGDEILLSFGDGDYWGIINVGNGNKFFNNIENNRIEKRSILIIDKNYLFENIDYPESPINVLIGSRKFAEGWNSFRVSVISLINLGASKGNKIIQIFGRGVRLKGIHNDGKRTFHDKEFPEYDELNNNDDTHLIRKLETLKIFSLKRNYLETFIEEVSKDIEHSYTLSIKVNSSPSRIKQHGEINRVIYEELPVFKLSKREINYKKVVINAGEINYCFYDDNIESEYKLKNLGFILDYRNNKFVEERDIINDLKEYVSKYYEYLNLNEINTLIKELSFEKEIQLYSLDGSSNLINCDILELLTLVSEFKVSKKEVKFTIENIENLLYKSIQDILNKLKNKINYNINSRNYIFNSPVRQQASSKDRLGDILYEYKVTKRFQTYNDKQEFIKDLDGQPDILKEELEVKSDYNIYEPLLVKNEDYNISPDYLNNGEIKFLKDIDKYISDFSEKNNDYEFYLLRNIDSLKSIGIYLENDEGVYYPDFILWIENKLTKKTAIVFFDPKGQRGIINESTLLQNDKVKLGEKNSGNNDLNDLSQILSLEHNKEIDIHSYILLRDTSELGKEKSKSNHPEDIKWIQENLINKNILRLNWHMFDERGNTSRLFNNESYLDIIFNNLNIK